MDILKKYCRPRVYQYDPAGKRPVEQVAHKAQVDMEFIAWIMKFDGFADVFLTMFWNGGEHRPREVISTGTLKTAITDKSSNPDVSQIGLNIKVFVDRLQTAEVIQPIDYDGRQDVDLKLTPLGKEFLECTHPGPNPHRDTLIWLWRKRISIVVTTVGFIAAVLAIWSAIRGDP